MILDVYVNYLKKEVLKKERERDIFLIGVCFNNLNICVIMGLFVNWKIIFLFIFGIVFI